MEKENAWAGNVMVSSTFRRLKYWADPLEVPARAFCLEEADVPAGRSIPVVDRAMEVKSLTMSAQAYPYVEVLAGYEMWKH